MSGGVAQFKYLKSIAGRHLVYDAVSAGAYRPERDGLVSAHLFEHIEPNVGAAVMRDSVLHKGFRLQRGAGGLFGANGFRYLRHALHLLTLYTACAANTLQAN